MLSHNGFAKIEGLVRYFLSEVNASSHSSFHENCLFPFNNWKKERHLSVDRQMNIFKPAIRPVNRWTSLVILGDGILRKAMIWFGFAYISLLESKYSRKSPDLTVKVHFDWFNFIMNSFSTLKHSCMCSTCWDASVDFTSISLMYTSIVFLSWLANIRLTSLW